MREIKFRAWDGTKNKMAGVAEIKFNSKTCEPQRIECVYSITEEEIYGTGSNEPCDIEIIEVLAEDVILEQYTGLKDKNGVEIYEGDKIDVHPEPEYNSCRKFIRTVEWNEEFAQFQALFKDGSGQLFTKRQCLTYEVIGNIHQHPELLGD